MVGHSSWDRRRLSTSKVEVGDRAFDFALKVQVDDNVKLRNV